MRFLIAHLIQSKIENPRRRSLSNLTRRGRHRQRCPTGLSDQVSATHDPCCRPRHTLQSVPRCDFRLPISSNRKSKIASPGRQSLSNLTRGVGIDQACSLLHSPHFAKCAPSRSSRQHASSLRPLTKLSHFAKCGHDAQCSCKPPLRTDCAC